MSKPYIKRIFSYSMVGSLGLTILASLQGCGGDQPSTPPPQSNNAGTISDAAKGEGMFMVIQQTGANPDTYELKEKYPASETRAILKDLNGAERILTEAELKAMAAAEAKRVEEGTSNLTQPVAENQGLGLGETILAAAAGALIGGMIANKLMGNSNYQQHQQQQASRAQTSISRPKSGGMDTRAVNPNQGQQPKSGFFGNNSGTSNPSNRSGTNAFGG
ncbi:hypothetical protein J9253_10935 [Thiothrix litoralis]|uniref:UPF0323 domain-containing protein n=1 Tax=Thiothrix litoralis TaxID=2891210 RepID=A0ABX7WNQ1_9GAMM|nr:hypothetical protein [Thiothrix litoralis]QTR44566.1 hypothetical protein J9253_10935 [Thiothrix litoralis]